MSELLPIWDSNDLTGGSTPPPFTIPNNPNAATLKINNQSRYWLILYKAQTNVDVDRIEPFSFIIMPAQADLGLRIDTTSDAATSLSPDKEFVDYSTIKGTINYFKGSTQFIGSSAVSIAGSVNIANSSLNVAIQGTPTINLAAGTAVTISNPTFQISSMPAVNLAAGTSVNITGTPTFNVGTMPAVTINNSSLNVTLTGANTVNIGNTPSVNINNSVTIASGTIDVNSANATIVNEQVQVAQIYSTKSTFTVPTTTTTTNPFQFNLQFLNNGTLANVHHVDVYITSSQGKQYNVSASAAFALMSDGHSWNASSSYGITYNGTNSASLDGPAVICNLIQLQIKLAAGTLTTADTITVYYAIDSNETAIGTTDGVLVKPYSTNIVDISGTITTASSAQQVLAATSYRRYIFFQNLSTSDMYINFGASPMPTIKGAGSIWVPANGGSFVMEGNYCSSDYLFVICATAGAAYTCKFF